MTYTLQVRKFLDDPPLPMCAVCGKPVDSVRQYEDSFKWDLVFVVECHGDQEITRIDKLLLQSFSNVQIGLTHAFSTKALPAPAKLLTEKAGETPDL